LETILGEESFFTVFVIFLCVKVLHTKSAGTHINSMHRWM